MKELLTLIKHFQLNKLFRTPTYNPFIQFFRYIFVGSIATATDWLVFYITDTAHPDWLYLSTASAFIAGLLVNYILSKAFVFPGSAIKNKTIEFLIYFIIGLIGLGLTELIMYIFASQLDLSHMAIKIAATVIVFFWNFGSKKIILYRK